MPKNFIVILVIALFFALILVSAITIIDNGRMRQALFRQQKLLAKVTAEKRSMEKDAARLKSESDELRAQKALYIATIETLVKKDSSSR